MAIGSSGPRAAAHFAARRKVPFPLLSDRERKTYKALGLKNGDWGDLVGPRVWGRGVHALRSRNLQGVTKGSVKQLGGAAVVLEGGEVVYLQSAESAADNAPVEELLAALR